QTEDLVRLLLGVLAPDRVLGQTPVGLERLDASLGAGAANAIDGASVIAERVEVTLDSLSALGPLSGLLIAAADALGLGANLDAILGEQDGRVEVRVRVAPVAPGLKVQVRSSLRAGGVGVADALSGPSLRCPLPS